MTAIAAQLEPSLREAPAETAVQFERHGYFKEDPRHRGAYLRTVTLRDSWAGQGGSAA
jgi:glutaminyl-tRNA synthetase